MSVKTFFRARPEDATVSEKEARARAFTFVKHDERLRKVVVERHYPVQNLRPKDKSALTFATELDEIRHEEDWDLALALYKTTVVGPDKLVRALHDAFADTYPQVVREAGFFTEVAALS